uniref:G domain-containing protein n=1 Tax=Amphimedon queenslandica TaxID=400682 RepID=A0A1X7UGQ1_AMPQE
MASPVVNPPEVHLRILFIGKNDTGKSSLINKFSGQNLAEVGDGIKPTRHKEPLMELTCTCSTPKGNLPITFCDTQGFYDMTTGNRTIADSVADKMKEANVILICHKLFEERVDGTVKEILGELARILGNNLMKHTILVFTKADCYPSYVNGKNDEIKSKMVAHASELMKTWKEALLSTGIKEDIVKDIPWCITSGHEDKLPTSDDWTKELWDLCEERCTPEAKGFVGWIRRHAVEIAQATIVAGTTTIGGVIGTFVDSAGGGPFVNRGRPGTAAGIAAGAGVGIFVGQGVSKILT